MHKKIKSYMNQVGRHCCLLTRESSHGELIILKPAVKREVDFYQDHLPRLSGLQAFVPRYYGLEEPGSPAAGVGNQVNQVADTCSSSSLLCRQGLRQALPYITMENLTAAYIRPCGIFSHTRSLSPVPCSLS